MFENRVIRRTFGPKRDEKRSGEDNMTRFILLAKYYSGDQSGKNEMGRTCSTYGNEKMCIRGFGTKALETDTTWKTQA